MYSAGTGSARLQPIVSEVYGLDAFSYYAVAVVKKSWCDATSNPTLASLKVSILDGQGGGSGG